MAKKITKIAANTDRSTVMERPRLNVCAYARVSTSSREQSESYATQIEYYTRLIESNIQWNFMGVYADGGISGTSTAKRDDFNNMIRECEEGNIDMIVTKSVTRFCRNTVDCIRNIRKLRKIGVGIYFEKENINTLTEKSELLITVLSSLAQSESEDFSGNNRWSIIKRFKDGTFIIGVPAYGYAYDENDNLLPVDEEAEIVRFIYRSYLNGMGSYVIAKELCSRGIPTIRTSEKWNDSTVQGILKNPIYIGDMLYQKSITTTCFPFVSRMNKGECPQYYIRDNHPPIITREEAEAVRELMEYRVKTLHNVAGEGQKRYVLSSRIICGICGKAFRRQKLYIGKPNEVIQWSCTTHIHDIKKCRNKAITQGAIYQAFVTLWNKLYTNQGEVLEPFVASLRQLPLYGKEKEQLEQIENRIRELGEQEHILSQVMANGYLEPAIFMEKHNLLIHELSIMRRKKITMHEKMNRSKIIVKTEQLIGLIREKDTLLHEFDEELFLLTVDNITISEQHEIYFHMKNGMRFKERGGVKDGMALTDGVQDCQR